MTGHGSVMAWMISLRASVIGFRNLVAHQYESLDRARIWEIITDDVPELKSVCERILG